MPPNCGYIHLSGVWLHVDLRMDTKKTSFKEKIGLCAQNLLPILGSTVNLIRWTYMVII